MPRESLNDRSKRILRELVTQYCMTGEPVGSRTLSKKANIGLSPATIRNVLSDLEEAGYITQPHTSAGRIPTDKGYRFYVNHLVRNQTLNIVQKDMIEKAMSHETGNFGDLLSITTELMARISHNVALAMAPNLERMTVENMDFVAIGPHRILAILVTKGGVVSNKVIDMDDSINQDELVQISNFIRTEFCGQTLPSIRKKIIAMMKKEQTQYDLMLKRAMILSQKTLEGAAEREQLFVLGASQLVNYPEFMDASRTRDLLEALEQKSKILHILNECIEGEGIHIVIGSENRDPELKNLSLVSSSYKFENQPIGIVGILGPTRMEYGKIIPLVDHIAKVVSAILTGTDAVEHG
jgi:heat-inducible transcriptional repressor